MTAEPIATLIVRSGRRSRASRRNLAVAGFASFAVIVVIAWGYGGLSAQTVASSADVAAGEVQSLKGIVPLQPATDDYIGDMLAAQQLGKALFWDTQAGSDGMACASCHFHAGVDIRNRNQVSPGAASQSAFARRASGPGNTGPNKVLLPTDLPFHQLADPTDRDSPVRYDTGNVIGSQGGLSGEFVAASRAVVATIQRKEFDVGPGTCDRSFDTTASTNDPQQAAIRLTYRQVEPRHAPSTINAAFYHRQFWDGRASNLFNGVDPFGARTFAPPILAPGSDGRIIGNPAARGVGILRLSGNRSQFIELVQPLLENSSLASQALGPPLSSFEVVCEKKSFADIGRRLLPMKPLSTQVSSPTDSLFSQTPELVNALPLSGLNTTYEELIRKAFNPKLWAATGLFTIDRIRGDVTIDPIFGYSQIEHNFSLFWGLSLQAYQRLLISDDAPVDRGPAAMSAAAQRGQGVFSGRGNCAACHNGPLFSAATVTSADGVRWSPLDSRLMSDGYPALLDRGFANTGVRPTKEDRGLGAVDPYGFDISFSRQLKWRQLKSPDRAPDKFALMPCKLTVGISSDCDQLPAARDPAHAIRDAVDGAFKIPTLRNIGLTAPYFHTGGQGNLKDVVRFYNRGGDRRGPIDNDTTGLDEETPFGVRNKSNLDPILGDRTRLTGRTLGLTEEEMDDLVQFLLSLTDERVACHSGVFDHPELPLIIGQKDAPRVGTQRAKDIVASLPAVGQAGLRTCFPNSGDFFGTLNTSDRRKQQDVFEQILR